MIHDTDHPQRPIGQPRGEAGGHNREGDVRADGEGAGRDVAGIDNRGDLFESPWGALLRAEIIDDQGVGIGDRGEAGGEVVGVDPAAQIGQEFGGREVDGLAVEGEERADRSGEEVGFAGAGLPDEGEEGPTQAVRPAVGEAGRVGLVGPLERGKGFRHESGGEARRLPRLFPLAAFPGPRGANAWHGDGFARNAGILLDPAEVEAAGAGRFRAWDRGTLVRGGRSPVATRKGAEPVGQLFELAHSALPCFRSRRRPRQPGHSTVRR